MRTLTSDDEGTAIIELVDHHDLGPACMIRIPKKISKQSTHFQYVNEVKFLKTSSGRPVFSLMKLANFCSSNK